MEPGNIAGRAEALAKLRDDSEWLLVVGGGITGACVVRDAALRGVKVCLVEKNDFAYGTSSRSSKLIHGGIRYLEQAQFGLVMEATRERAILSRIASHLVRPLSFIYPIYREDRRSMFEISLGLTLYDILSLGRSYRFHRMPGKAAVAELEPRLKMQRLVGAGFYYDATTDDALLTVAMIQDAVRHGAVCLNQMSYHGADSANGRVVSARLRDEETGTDLSLKINGIVHAAGPFTDEVMRNFDEDSGSQVRPTKGAHLVFSRDRFPLEHAVVLNSVVDGRVNFAIPWGPGTLFGTTDTDYNADKSSVQTTREDVRYLLGTVQKYFPELALTEDDICSTYAGLRPLVHQPGKSAYRTSREHEIFSRPDGVVTICGGKYTTCRSMAKEALDEVLDLTGKWRKEPTTRCRTSRVSLLDADGLAGPSEVFALQKRLVSEYELSPDQAEHFLRAYGNRAVAVVEAFKGTDGAMTPLVEGLPYVWGDVDAAVREGFARTTSDVLRRRTRVFFLAADQGKEISGDVSKRIGELLGRDSDWVGRDQGHYLDDVARNRAWMDEP